MIIFDKLTVNKNYIKNRSIIMKLQLIAIVTALSLSGCIVFPVKKADITKPYNESSIDFKPSNSINRVETKGQVICEAGKPCTELTFDWKIHTNNLYKVRADLYDPQAYDIQRITFKVDGQTYPYVSTEKSTQKNLLNSTLINSSNYIEVPASLITILYNAKAIDVSVFTDKGEISHSALKDGEESRAYKTFKRGYAQKNNP